MPVCPIPMIAHALSVWFSIPGWGFGMPQRVPLPLHHEIFLPRVPLHIPLHRRIPLVCPQSLEGGGVQVLEGSPFLLLLVQVVWFFQVVAVQVGALGEVFLVVVLEEGAMVVVLGEGVVGGPQGEAAVSLGRE